MKRGQNLEAIIMIGLITVAAILWADDSCAETYLYLGGSSYHFDRSYDYNETNDLYGIEYNNWIGLRFNNSYHQESYAALYNWEVYKTDQLTVSLFPGAVYGYNKCFGHDNSSSNVCPTLLPAVTFTEYRVQPSFVTIFQGVAITTRYKF